MYGSVQNYVEMSAEVSVKVVYIGCRTLYAVQEWVYISVWRCLHKCVEVVVTIVPGLICICNLIGAWTNTGTTWSSHVLPVLRNTRFET